MTASSEHNPAGDGAGADETAPTGPAADRPATPHPIVAIGASAGGLQALQAFFGNLPSDPGIGFVVITHVARDRESLLAELLGNVTDLEVADAEPGLAVDPNTVLVARDATLTIANGTIGQAAHDNGPPTHHPIDQFFRHLAADRQEHAIGIVLSGSGNDGTLGIKAIKAAGGMVMAQSPGSAGSAGMPDSAIATGLVDYIDTPENLPGLLTEYCSGPFLQLAARTKEAPRLPNDIIHSVLVRLRSHTGHDFTCYKHSTMARRIERRMNVHRIEEPQTYVRYLRDHPHELDLLQRELLISVTSFFRDPEAFETLRTEALPTLLEERSDDDTIRAWVPGCATGEEAYTVAIVLHEALLADEHGCELHVFGTDLDAQAIEKARSGLYPHGIAADVPHEYLEHYFTQEDDGYRIHKKIRDSIVFAQQNVISDPPFTRLDLIVCRNLLIYLVSEAQQRVLPSFHYALKPGGLLMLGSSESLGESSRLFESLDRQHRILRRRETPTPEPLQLSGLQTGGRSGGHDSTREDEQPEYRGRSKPLTRTIERFLLERLAGCTVLVDDQGTVVYLCGHCGQFLQPEQGEPRNRLLDMAREGLGPHLAAAVRRAKSEGGQVVQRGIRVQTNGETITVEAAVEPLQAPESLRGLVLVSLRSSDPPTGEPSDEAPGVPLPANEREQLERELRYTRESLQTTVEELETSNEELKSSNEELQSTNEELQSSNEELETSKEELQSLNEELNTVNAELQSKVEALARSNDDMSNLLNSMQVATVFLDGDLRVKRYTRKAQEVIRLIDSDLGRPLSDLTSSLEYDELIDDCRQVLGTLTPIEREVQDTEGRWMMIRILPYRTADNVIEGLVMTIVDIDRAKRAQLGRDLFASIVDTVREPLLVLDSELQVVQTNEPFLKEFQTTDDATEQRKLYALDDGQWDIAELRRLLEEILAESTIMTDFVVEHDFPRIGHRRFLLNARRLEGAPDAPDRILLAFERAHAAEEGS